MFWHYIDAFECHGAWKGHWANLALKCFTVADELRRYHRRHKQADLWNPKVRKTQWKDLPHDPQDDCHSSYNLALASMGSPKQPSYRHPKLLGQYFDHMYQLSGIPVGWDPTPTKPRLNPQALEAQFKYGQRTLPPPPELRRPKDDLDSWNVVLRAIQTPKVVDTRLMSPIPKTGTCYIWTGMPAEMQH